MPGLKTATSEIRSGQDLKPLFATTGVCASVYMTLKTPAKTNSLEWRETIRPLETKLRDAGADGVSVWESLSGWEPQGDELAKAKAVAVFCSPTAFSFAKLQQPVRSRAVVGPRFYVRPLLAAMENAKKFYILALSQKDVRLLRCDASTSEEVKFPGDTVTGFEAYMNTAKPDHSRANMTSAGQASGHSKGVVGSTDTEREDKPEYLNHFFQQIDRGLNQLLRGSSDPLVLVGVDPVLAQYRAVNKYPNLSEEVVQGAPNGLKAGEMHARALEALNRNQERRIDRVLAEYDHKAGGGASNRLKEIVSASHDGRVVTLMISDSLETTGVFDEQTRSAKGAENGGSEEQDLVNDAAVQTLLHAGQVLIVANKKMPNGAPAAAIFRY